MQTSHTRDLLFRLGLNLSQRKVRLLCCSLWRFWESKSERSYPELLDLAERFADQRATTHELAAARFAGRGLPGLPAPFLCWPIEEDSETIVRRILSWSHRRDDDAKLVSIIQDIAGPAEGDESTRIDPVWLAWEDSTIPRLARVLYDDREFERLPILADALEDAGCTETGLLEHLRQGADGIHVRGCWALDSILGLE